MAGNFFVIKAVGAASERGDDLEEVVRIGKKVNDVTRTMGVALTACTPPAKGRPLFDLGADEMEVGVGIHGEPGRERGKLVAADDIVDELLEAVVTDLPYASGDRVALMVNGLGGTPISELYILYRRAHKQLADRGITVARSYVTSTAPRWTWQVRRSRWSSSTTRSRSCSPPRPRCRSASSDPDPDRR